MRLPTPDPLTLAALTVAMAGMTDVVAFLALGGFFAASMGADATRLAIGVTANWLDLQLAASLILAFVGGTTIAAVLRRRNPVRAKAIVLTFVAGLLAIAALFASFPSKWPLLLLAMAMGAVNLAFDEQGGVRIGPAHMASALVRLGQTLGDRLSGVRSGDWVWPLLLWGSFIGGGLIGVGLYARFGLVTLWVPTAMAAGLAVLAWRATSATAEQEDGADQH